MHMLRKPIVYYDKIYFHTSNSHQHKTQDLTSFMEKISKKVGYNIIKLVVKMKSEIQKSIQIITERL